MRIRWVRAEAFGALADKTLELGDGLNVVVGPNDSGKSTWHAALYAALCGHPLVPDETTPAQARADQKFRRDRRPRRFQGWSVEAEIELDPDHRLLVQQNLLNPQTSTVTVPDDSDDVPNLERLHYDGGIDVSRVVGLTRRSYAATAWVPQDRPMVFDDEASREELQRVIAEYVGADDAGKACDRIRDYRKWRIGSDSEPATLLGQGVAASNRALAARDQAMVVEQNRVRAEQRLSQLRTTLASLQKQQRVAEAIAAKSRAKRIGDAVQKLRGEIERLREELARMRGDSTANTQAATVYKFPGFVADKDGPSAESPSIGGGRGSDKDPLGVFGKREDETGSKATATVTLAPAAAAPAPAASPTPYGSSRHSADPYGRGDVDTLMLKPLPDQAEGEAVDPDADDVTWRAGREGIGLVEGVVFPVLFFGGLLLAAVGLGLSIILQSLLAAGLAVAAVMLAIAGLAVRLAVRRQRERIAAARSVFEKPADVATDDIPENITLVYEPPVEDVVEEVDEKTVRAYEALIAEKDRQLRLMQEEQWAADEEANRQSTGLDPYELFSMNDLDDALLAREKAKNDVESGLKSVAEAEAEVAALNRESQRLPSLREAEAAYAEAQAELATLRKRDRLLEEAVEHLTLAVAAAREKITDGVETRLREYLPEVTRNQHSMVDVDRALRVRVGDQSQPMDNPTPGSRGTVEQTHLLRLVALGRHLGYGHEAGPLLLDDVTSNADSVRTPRILELLHRIAESRQVVVFAHEDLVRDWALQRRVDDPRVRVFRLESVRKQPNLLSHNVDEL
jgi:hypothetical protein